MLFVTAHAQGAFLAQGSNVDSTSLLSKAETSLESAGGGNLAVQGYTLSSEQYARAVSYCQGEYWLYFLRTAYVLLVLGAMVRWRFAPRLRDRAERVSRRMWMRVLLLTPVLLLVFGVLLLPTDAYAQWHARRYGLSVQGWASWLGIWITTEMTTIICGTLVVGVLYSIIRRSPNRWWLFLWLITVPLFVLIAFIQPVAIDPLFNTFQSLDLSHPELVNTIEALLSRAGLVIPREHIYLLEVSDKSKEVDASSEGFGPTKRIFVSDTIIASEPGPVILHTLGHEIGHYMLRLDWILFAIGVPLSLGFLYVVDRTFVWVLSRWGSEWQIRSPDDYASLPVLALIFALLAVVLTPAVNTLSRYREQEADRYGLELIHNIVPKAGEAAARAFQNDAEINLSDPAPSAFVKWWLFDHPPVNDRIIFCRTYDPWSSGRSPRYVQ